MFMLVVSLVSIFLPAIFIGMLFPMIGTLAVFRKQHAASNVGLIYAVNTVGCIIGSLTCGLILMPTIGSFAALQWIVRLSTLTGILACCYAEKISPKLKAALLILPAFLAMAYSSAPIRDILPKGTSLLAHGEDTTGMMKVVLIPRDQEIQLVLNGNCLAASSPISCRYMRLLGNLPLLLHKKPENVLVGCFGTGTTCGAVALDPSVKHVDLVELSNMVLSVSPLFRKTNYDVLLNPKVSVHVNDVRNFLLTTKQKYDVVTFEPPPPTEAGVVNLYTEEFYQLLSQRINPDGIICQWIPMHQESSKLWKMMISAARSVFPYVSVWLPDNKEAVLIASAQPITMDFARMQDRLKSAPILQSSLQDVGLGSPMALLSTYIGSGEDLDKFIDNSLPITDNFPRLEFFLSYAGIPATELEVEKMGHADLLRLVAENRKQKGFDEAEFWKQWQAVHLLRQIESAGSNQQADQCIDLARTLVPGSKWLEYVDSHRDRFYRRDDASWIHGP